MVKYLLICGLAAVLSCGMFGCQDSVNSVENAEKNMIADAISDRRVVTDGYLRDRLKIIEVDQAQTSQGLMQIQVVAMNVRVGWWDQFCSWFTNEDPYPITYKFTWFNSQAMEYETPMSVWKQQNIYPGETVYFRAIAPNADCKDFMLNIKEGSLKR